jgi:hypothetical protein
VRGEVAPDQGFAIGQSSSSVELDEAAWLDALDKMRLGTRVKEEVSLLDWRDEKRLRFTNASADHLAEILPEDIQGSVSTAPGTFKTNETSLETVGEMADRFIRQAAHLVELERNTGRSIRLAVEVEPACFLKTTAEAIAFFQDRLFSRAAVNHLIELTDLAPVESESAICKHHGLCLDLCHATVEFEESAAVYTPFRAAGLSVAKMQASSGPRLPTVGHNTRVLLKPFDDSVYLRQVIENRNGGVTRYPNLAQVYAALDAAPGPDGREWRAHYHIPLFLDDISAFSSTQSFECEALALHRQEPTSQHLEVKTYTWVVLSERYRAASLAPAIARELQWVRQQFPA